MMKKLHLYAVGFAESDRQLLAGFIKLVALIDGHVFTLSPEPECAIVIVNQQSGVGVKTLQNPVNGTAYIAYSETLADGVAAMTRRKCAGAPGDSGRDQDQASQSKIWDLIGPIRLVPLREILHAVVQWRIENHIDRNLAPTRVANASIHEAVTHEPLLAPHRKLAHLLRIISRTRSEQTAQTIHGIAGLQITMFHQSQQVGIRMAPPASGKTTSLAEPATRQTSLAEPATGWMAALVACTRSLSATPNSLPMQAGNFQLISMQRFEWELAHGLSGGVLFPGIAHMQYFYLKSWPDFAALGVEHAIDLRVCALLSARPVTMAQILKEFPTDQPAVIALINACALLGFLNDAPQDLLIPIGATPNFAAQGEPPRVNGYLPMHSSEIGAQHDVLAKQSQKNSNHPALGFSGLFSKLRSALSFAPTKQ
jgi:hypothetical protein